MSKKVERSATAESHGSDRVQRVSWTAQGGLQAEGKEDDPADQGQMEIGVGIPCEPCAVSASRRAETPANEEGANVEIEPPQRRDRDIPSAAASSSSALRTKFAATPMATTDSPRAIKMIRP